ncbi:MAG TPA: ATP-dependent helicase HrpB [Longimicrobiales bacterium]|nr:ATP-dependent helicase HrpB [Longimicrobiales bacterium]
MRRTSRDPWSRLPVAAAIPAVRAALASPGAAVLVAPPGAGKTTVVPLALLEEGWAAESRIIVLEPRRLAARAAADRMAWLLGEEEPGGTVGYRVRNDTRVGPGTRIEVVTEGVLTRMLQSDAALEGVGLVVFDEFHERSLHADLGLALTLQTRAVLRPDLRVLVMSATLDAAPVAALLGEAPVVRSEGRTHPVETRWRKAPVEGWIEPAVVRSVLGALDREEGDVLVFLPGAAEIRRTERGLGEAGLPASVTVHTLFGALPRGAQERAIAPSPPGTRKVVLATSIAETSLTIEGVRVVVDAGLMRVPRFDPGTGMTRLETVRVTRDAADQRRGRAGRVAPGVCYRLWTRAEERGLVPHRRPEIQDADLAPVALELAAWGAAPEELRWLDPPPDAAYRQSLELLRGLEALGDDDAITDHGRRMVSFGLHPRLAHMALRGAEGGAAEAAAALAALLSERDILRGPGRAADADLRLRLDVLRGRSPAGHEVDRGALRSVREDARRIAGRLEPGVLEDPPSAGDGARAPSPGLLVALAYPDRIARRRAGERGRFLLRNGRGARFLEPQALEGEDWLAVAEVEGRGAEARIFRAAPLTLEEIEAWFGARIEETAEVAWDGAAARVVSRRVRRLGALTLGEAPLRDPPPDAVAAALLEGVRAAGAAALPWGADTTQLRERLELLHRLEPERWPSSSEAELTATLDAWLAPFLAGLTRLEDLRKVDLAAALLARLPRELRSKLDALAPTHVEVPSGSRIRVDYADPGAPVLAVRLQEVFGMLETPRIAGGRVPLTMHLLSPARRPVQVTQDLASFWREGYFEVRKDLRGRYPKHAWPEDPLRAEPTRRTKPRRP